MEKIKREYLSPVDLKISGMLHDLNDFTTDEEIKELTIVPTSALFISIDRKVNEKLYLDFSKNVQLENINVQCSKYELDGIFKHNVDYDKFMDVVKTNDGSDYDVRKDMNDGTKIFSSKIILPYGCKLSVYLVG